MALHLDQEVDDLLDLMGGGGPSEPSATATASTSRAHSSSEDRRGKERKNKKRKKEKRKRSKSNGNKRISYADTRLTQNCFEWPCNGSGRRSLSLGSGLMHPCDGYDPDGGRYGASICKSCGRSGASHQLQFESDVGDASFGHHLVRIVVAARNARCIMGECHPAVEGVNAEEISEKLDKFVGRTLRNAKTVPQFPEDDVRLLKEKVSALIEAVEGFKRAVRDAITSVDGTSTKRRMNLVESRLAAMAASDVVYYRCYYMAATTNDAVEGLDLAAKMPHPPTYFSVPGLAWDVEDAGLEFLSQFLGQAEENQDDLVAPLDDATRSELLTSWGLQKRLSSPSSDHSNPLLVLWQSRFMETIRHVWTSGYSRMKSSKALRAASATGKDDAKRKAAHVSGQEALLQMHEASALSPRMAQWRDSIRDYPANFYAYAAPTEEALQCISDCVESLGIEQILEAGAGTGYWSTLLRSHLEDSGRARVPTVVPYDIAPSSALANEYHGNIPPFTDVKKAESLSQALAASPGTGAKTALMLCYPPPSSDMAHQALSAHMANGGQMVLHIGEWQGLTGDASFEDLLRRNFSCLEKDTVPLPVWGTDATYLTVWRKKSSGMHMLHKDASNYEDDGHFIDLRHISMLSRATDDSDRPRKKRKKKRKNRGSHHQ
ncbi:hypothetical protein ACHAXT_001221 [Thalassiosira profunda]